jgi:hypothetical protein
MDSVQDSAASPSQLPVLVHDLASCTDDSQTNCSISSQALSTVAIDVENPQGWVLALDPASLQTFLWRPQDGEMIQLPPKDN